MKTTRLLVVVVLLQGLILLGQWTGAPVHQRAYAEAPEAMNSRALAVDELRDLNRKMDKLLDILGSGNLQVRVASPDDNTKESGRHSGR